MGELDGLLGESQLGCEIIELSSFWRSLFVKWTNTIVTRWYFKLIVDFPSSFLGWKLPLSFLFLDKDGIFLEIFGAICKKNGIKIKWFSELTEYFHI